MSTKLAALALIAVVAVAAVAVYAVFGTGGDDDGQDGNNDNPTDPTTPTVPTDPEIPVGPEEPTDPDIPTDPDTPTDPDNPAGSTSFALRTDIVVGDSLTVVVPSGNDLNNPLATVSVEVVSIDGDLMDIRMSSDEESEVYEEIIEDIPVSYFPEIYMILFAFMPGQEPGETVFVGTDTIDTIHGSLECSHYAVSNFGDVWCYPGTEYPAMIIMSDRTDAFFFDTTILIPTNRF